MKSAKRVKWKGETEEKLLFIKEGVRRNVENGVQNMVEEF